MSKLDQSFPRFASSIPHQPFSKNDNLEPSTTSTFNYLYESHLAQEQFLIVGNNVVKFDFVIVAPYYECIYFSKCCRAFCDS